jgi:hypothetical protein
VGAEEQAALQQGELAEAQQAPENADLDKNDAKIGDLNVTATLVTTETAPARKVIRLECQNPTHVKFSGKIQVALTRTKGSGMERVMPTPQIAWRHIETVDVAPGETFVREVSMPKNVSAEVLRIEKLREKAAESETARPPTVYYGAIAEALAPAAVPARSSSKPALVKTPSMPRDPRVAELNFGY